MDTLLLITLEFCFLRSLGTGNVRFISTWTLGSVKLGWDISNHLNVVSHLLQDSRALNWSLLSHGKLLNCCFYHQHLKSWWSALWCIVGFLLQWINRLLTIHNCMNCTWIVWPILSQNLKCLFCFYHFHQYQHLMMLSKSQAWIQTHHFANQVWATTQLYLKELTFCTKTYPVLLWPI